MKNTFKVENSKIIKLAQKYGISQSEVVKTYYEVWCRDDDGALTAKELYDITDSILAEENK